jgi:hypothetical protein
MLSGLFEIVISARAHVAAKLPKAKVATLIAFQAVMLSSIQTGFVNAPAHLQLMLILWA